jgi:hypothetical protein
MSRFFLLTVLILAACSRGPDEAALQKQVQEQIDKSFKPGLLELAGLKRQGSSPLPGGRIVVYYNATLRLKEGYDFKDWEGLSPATLAQVLGGREKGVLGVKAKVSRSLARASYPRSSAPCRRAAAGRTCSAAPSPSTSSSATSCRDRGNPRSRLRKKKTGRTRSIPAR